MRKAMARGYLGRQLTRLLALPVKRTVLSDWERVKPLLHGREDRSAIMR